MERQFCPECGHENPAEARFCMDCGHALQGEAVPQRARQPAATHHPQDQGTDWTSIAAAILAFLSLQHLSRKARGVVIALGFFVLFFGCPMVCGFGMYLVDSILQLFQ